MKVAIIIVAAISLSGCAEHYVWSKPGARAGEFDTQLARCKMYAQANTPMYVPQQLPPNYVANTDYSGTFNGTRYGNTVSGNTYGTATTTVEARPNPWNGVSAIVAGIGNHNRTVNNTQLCLQANGWRKKEN